MRVYLSGPISGAPDFRERFAAAEEYVRHLGCFSVVNPASFSCMALWSWADSIIFDLGLLRDVDALVSLPGACASRGARIEMEFARGHGIPVLDLCDFRSWAAAAQRGVS